MMIKSVPNNSQNEILRTTNKTNAKQARAIRSAIKNMKDEYILKN